MKIVHSNKKAYFDFEIVQELEAGIVLSGSEIKSVRAGQINLKGSYVNIQAGEAYLKGAHISRYAFENNAAYDPFRLRKLLLHKKEIETLSHALQTQGVTVVPLAVGLAKKYAKVTLGVGRGKKKNDKRNTIKERDTKRQTQRVLKQY